MHVALTSTQGNPNIGLYAYATDEYVILGPDAHNLEAELAEALDVPIITTTIAGTSLAGVFLAGNKQTLLVPSITFEHEIELLKKHGINVHVLDTKHTALGNNIVANNHGALIAPIFSEQERADIAEALGVDTHQFSIADIEVVGSGLAITSKGGLIHRDANNFEKDMAQDTLRLPKLLSGTVNLGIPYVRSGIIANKNGFLIGNMSGGPEITNADEAFGFIEG